MPLVDRWGHVVSDGFFYAKPDNLTKQVLRQVLAHLRDHFYMSAQDGMNIALSGMKVKWQRPKKYERVFSAGILFKVYQDEVVGSFLNGTGTVSVLPHAQYMHIVLKTGSGNATQDPYIVKVFYNRKFASPDKKIEAMHGKGMWYLVNDWQDRPYRGDPEAWLGSVSKDVKLQVHYAPRVLDVRRYTHPPRFPPDNTTHFFMQSEMSASPNVTEYHWDTEFFHFALAVDKNALRERLVASAVNNTVVVAFSNKAFLDMLLNWLVAVHRAGVRNYVVMAMDTETRDLLEARGVPTFLVVIKHVTALLSVRTVLWSTIAEVGVNFVQTDIDAVWLRNPLLTYFNAQSPHDIVFTQGTVSPPITHDSWGFVLCSGVFFAKATPFGTHMLYQMLENQLLNPLVPRRYTDQDAVNIIVRNAAPKWHVSANGGYHLWHNSVKFRCFTDTIVGHINGTNNTVAIVPYHLFPRTIFDPSSSRLPNLTEPPYVKHFFSVNRERLKLTKTSTLRESGLWLLQDARNDSAPQLHAGAWLDSLLNPDWRS